MLPFFFNPLSLSTKPLPSPSDPTISSSLSYPMVTRLKTGPLYLFRLLGILCFFSLHHKQIVTGQAAEILAWVGNEKRKGSHLFFLLTPPPPSTIPPLFFPYLRSRLFTRSSKLPHSSPLLIPSPCFLYLHPYFPPILTTPLPSPPPTAPTLHHRPFSPGHYLPVHYLFHPPHLSLLSPSPLHPPFLSTPSLSSPPLSSSLPLFSLLLFHHSHFIHASLYSAFCLPLHFFPSPFTPYTSLLPFPLSPPRSLSPRLFLPALLSPSQTSRCPHFSPLLLPPLPSSLTPLLLPPLPPSPASFFFYPLLTFSSPTSTPLPTSIVSYPALSPPSYIPFVFTPSMPPSLSPPLLLSLSPSLPTASLLPAIPPIPPSLFFPFLPHPNFQPPPPFLPTSSSSSSSFSHNFLPLLFCYPSPRDSVPLHLPSSPLPPRITSPPPPIIHCLSSTLSTFFPFPSLSPSHSPSLSPSPPSTFLFSFPLLTPPPFQSSFPLPPPAPPFPRANLDYPHFPPGPTPPLFRPLLALSLQSLECPPERRIAPGPSFFAPSRRRGHKIPLPPPLSLPDSTCIETP